MEHLIMVSLVHAAHIQNGTSHSAMDRDFFCVSPYKQAEYTCGEGEGRGEKELTIIYNRHVTIEQNEC
eukprot:3598350-Ditylum_brightwellii.AAC.1